MFKTIDYDKIFVIGTPLVGWKCDNNEDMSWIENRLSIMEKFPNARFFAALELDTRGLEPFSRVIAALEEVGGDYWTYSINDKEEEVTYSNRWIRIETGRNLVREFAQRKRNMAGLHWGEKVPQEGFVNYDAVLYVDSDIELTPQIIEKLLEVDHHIVSVDVPAYGLSGPVVNKNPRVEEHWNTAGVLLINSPHFYDLPWYHNSYMNLSDDPTFQYLAERLYGRQTFVRKDVTAKHLGFLVPVEKRGIGKRKYNES